MTSHARNFEDVLLWRALKEIEAGFYVDIGAGDPVLGSVSLAFYQRGWRGLHVEANIHHAGKLRAARPDEEVVQAAISATSGPAPAVRLDALLDKMADRDVHWMRIGAGQVIESWGDSQVRPWVVVAEESADWDPFLLAKGYRAAHFDGLNRFYVSEAHADLAGRLAVGPNLFDDFVLAETSDFARPLAAELGDLRQQSADQAIFCDALEKGRAEDRIYIGHLEEAVDRYKRDLAEIRQTAQLQQEAIDSERAEFIRHQTELQQRHEELRQGHEELQHQARAIAGRLHAIESSRSWRWTGALRRAARLLKGRP
ncbi:MAG TPA: hypothetical protein VKP60_07340 [Magnetospirillaceae bacterium]|nr:hypothetical protein [Magnetospirillaceae bacterium]